MKKVISILAACMLVLSFAGMAAAQCETCETDPGYINRGCESGTTGQFGQPCTTTPFDYEDFGGWENTSCLTGMNSYCTSGGKGDIHRALIAICECIPDPFEDVLDGETFDIGMTILVDRQDGNGPVEGNNGVYWAEDVNVFGVGMQTFSSAGAACAWEECSPENAFVGEFEYILWNGVTTGAGPYTGTACDVPDAQEIVEFRAVANQEAGTHGYTVTEADAISNNSVWWVDIPMMRVDSGIAQKGWDVYVEVCVYETLDQGGVCGTCEGCCCLIKIGTLCCPDPVDVGCSDTLIFPYFPKTESYWYGMAITNVGDADGEATITLYENDGDVATATVTVPANSTKVVVPADLTTSGTVGDAQSYAKAVANFPASGFAMMAKESNGVSMGYLAEKVECLSNCLCGQW